MIRLRLSATLAAAALLVAGCGDGGSGGRAAGTEEIQTPIARIPAQILGLTVGLEDVSDRLRDLDRAYVDSVAVLSLRDGDLMRATLQINRFTRAARPGDRNFQRQIVEQVGTVAPTELSIADTRVYTTAGTDQDMYIWFEGRGMFVLGIQEVYEFPRTLLRRVLETVTM